MTSGKYDFRKITTSEERSLLGEIPLLGELSLVGELSLYHNFY